MKPRTNVIRSSSLLLGIVLWLAGSRSGALTAGAVSTLATIRYVDVNSTNATPPYSSWATAATNIQDAVDAAAAGDEIVMTNGIYSAGGRSTIDDSTINRVTVDKPLRVRSVNGPQTTTIDGGHSNRCVYLANGASLCGFTLANGAAYGGGGGLWCESTNAVVSNCVLSGNWAFDDFLRAIFYPFGGGVFGGTLSNCTLSNNYALSINQNLAFGFGGGAYAAALNNCTLSGNVAAYGGGACGCTLNGCTLTDNSATGRRSSGGGADGCRLNNCTLAGNSATYDGGGAFGCLLNNCIVYLNTANQGANYDSSSTLNYSCTTPLPTDGLGNITNEPLFVDQAGGNLRLQSDSPCINAGLNAFAPAGPDLDGNPRISGATVDMGAYEFQTIALVNPAKLPGGAFQFAVTGAPNGAYTVLATTNVALPITQWMVLGVMPEFSPGLYLFSDAQANGPQRFYQVVKGSWLQSELPCLGAGPNPCPFQCHCSRTPLGFYTWSADTDCRD